MKSVHTTVIVLLLLLLFLESASARYYDDQCCSSALSANAFHPAPTQPPICGQEYNQSIPAAPKANIRYSFCRQNCSGFGLSQGHHPSQWAAPIVQFILPSVIFSMTIPRRRMFSLSLGRNPTFGGVGAHCGGERVIGALKAFFKLLGSLFTSVIRFSIVIFDNIIWIAIILALAGPMMLSGLHEAVLDWRILTALSNYPMRDDFEVVELLATVVSGNLLLNSDNPNQPNPQVEITNALINSDRDERRSRLFGLMTSQYNFGAIAGAPVLFYLGAFLYTILDLSNKPSDQDAAISLAFGVEWMIIVHVSIIAACVLASNNPSTTSVLVGRSPPEAPRWLQKASTQQILNNQLPPNPFRRFRAAILRLQHGQLGPLRFLDDIYKDRYQPVTMWKRGQNKQEWVWASRAWERLQPNAVNPANAPNQVDNGTGMSPRDLRVTTWRYLLFVILATLVLINLPPTAGAVVAWRTPPIGWGCRSLSFVCYAGCQFLLVWLFLAKTYLSVWHKERWYDTNWSDLSWRKILWCAVSSFFNFVFVLFYILTSIASLFVALGGTLMQVIGVYRNCFCYVNANKWYHLDSAFVNVASDTQEQRDSSANWITFGGAATGFMGLCCYIGWWYQNIIRKRYQKVVNELCREPDGQPAAAAMNGHLNGPSGDSSNTSSNDASRRVLNAPAFEVTDDTIHPPLSLGAEYPQTQPTSETALLPPSREDSWSSSRPPFARGAIQRQRTNATSPWIELENRVPSR
jgi:hypothetical protein